MHDDDDSSTGDMAHQEVKRHKPG